MRSNKNKLTFKPIDEEKKIYAYVDANLNDAEKEVIDSLCDAIKTSRKNHTSLGLIMQRHPEFKKKYLFKKGVALKILNYEKKLDSGMKTKRVEIQSIELSREGGDIILKYKPKGGQVSHEEKYLKLQECSMERTNKLEGNNTGRNKRKKTSGQPKQNNQQPLEQDLPQPNWYIEQPILNQNLPQPKQNNQQPLEQDLPQPNWYIEQPILNQNLPQLNWYQQPILEQDLPQPNWYQQPILETDLIEQILALTERNQYLEQQNLAHQDLIQQNSNLIQKNRNLEKKIAQNSTHLNQEQRVRDLTERNQYLEQQNLAHQDLIQQNSNLLQKNRDLEKKIAQKPTQLNQEQRVRTLTERNQYLEQQNLALIEENEDLKLALTGQDSYLEEQQHQYPVPQQHQYPVPQQHQYPVPQQHQHPVPQQHQQQYFLNFGLFATNTNNFNSVQPDSQITYPNETASSVDNATPQSSKFMKKYKL